MTDAQKAALNLYPESWRKIGTICGEELQIDDNCTLRKNAEKVFEHVFEILKSEQVADGVAKAFIRRSAKYGTSDNGLNAANMSTALMAAIVAIRDANKLEQGE